MDAPRTPEPRRWPRPAPLVVLAVTALVAGCAVIGVAGALDRPTPDRIGRAGRGPTGVAGAAADHERAGSEPADDPGPTSTTRPDDRPVDPPTSTSTTRATDPTDPARCAAGWPRTAGEPPAIADVAATRTGPDTASIAVTFRSACGVAFFGDGPPRRANGTSVGFRLAAPCAGSRFAVESARDPDRFGGIGVHDGQIGTCEGGGSGAIYAADADLVAGTWADGTVVIPLRLLRCPSNGTLLPTVELLAWDGGDTFVQPEQVAATWPGAAIACGP